MSEHPYWLIELWEPYQSRPKWLRITYCGNDARIDWTEDATVALAFHRQSDAYEFGLLHPKEMVFARITEHQNIEAPHA